MTSTIGKTIICKAAVVHEFNKPICVEKVEVQPPQANEVRVKIIASGLCHSDLNAINGYHAVMKLPFVLGHEGAGVVESVGAGVTSVKPGDKVLTIFMPQCNQCKNCASSTCNNCLDPYRKEDPDSAPLRTTGLDGKPRFSQNGKPVYHTFGCSSFSEYTVVPENSCVKIDPKSPLEKTCLLACGFPTGFGSSANMDIKPEDTTAVWGLGGVGLSTVFGCKTKKAKTIIGIDINPDKAAIAKKMGCTHFICVKDLKKPLPDAIKEIAPLGLDYAFVCLGRAESIEDAINSTADGGTTVIVGVAHDDAIAKFKPCFLLRGRSIKGVLYGFYKPLTDIPKLAVDYLGGKLPLDDLITGTCKLDQIGEAIRNLQEGKTIRSVILM